MKRAIKKIGAVLAMLTVCASVFALGASAASSGKHVTNHDTLYNEPKSRSGTGTIEGSKYSVEVMYILGAKNNPFSNPSLTAKAGTMSDKYKYTFAVINETSNGEQCVKKNEAIGNTSYVKFTTIEANAWEYGQYGTGYCTAQAYSGTEKSNSLAWEMFFLYSTYEDGSV